MIPNGIIYSIKKRNDQVMLKNKREKNEKIL